VTRSLARKGFDLIIGTSFGYMDGMETVATEFPDKMFIHVSGYKANGENFGNLMGAMEDMKYLAGVLAGARCHMDGQTKVGYMATFPILVNMNGKPTYFMTLKDGAGLVKMFCFVSVSDFSTVGVGETIKAARDNFQMALAGSRIGNLAEGSAEKTTLEGTVARLGSDIKDGRTFYYFSLKENPGVIYIATSNLSSYLPITTIGDKVRIAFLRSEDKEISLTELKNLSMGE